MWEAKYFAHNNSLRDETSTIILYSLEKNRVREERSFKMSLQSMVAPAAPEI